MARDTYPETPATETPASGRPTSKRRQTICRIERRHNFTQLPNDLLRNKKLKIDARGTLAFILSYPNDWQFKKTWLCRELGIGREKADSILQELEAAGYLRRRQLRGVGGKLGDWEYTFTDDPSVLTEAFGPQPEKPTAAKSTAAGKPACGRKSSKSPQPGKPEPVKPEPVNPHPTNTVRDEDGKDEDQVTITRANEELEFLERVRAHTCATPTPENHADVVEEDSGQIEIIAHGGKSKAPRKRSAAATILDEQWHPGEPGLRYAIEKGLTEAEIKVEFEAFRNYYLGKGSRWVNWHRVWQNWVIKAVKFKAERTASGGRRNGRMSMDDVCDAAFGKGGRS